MPSLKKFSQLPRGYRDSQEAGSYELKASKNRSLFRWPKFIKEISTSSQLEVWSASKDKQGNLNLQS
ncbi:MAG: hypothetical protein AB8G05_15610 [Oligoflexales bacterium]